MKIDLIKLLLKMPSIPNVVFKSRGVSSGCPWKPFLLGKWEWVDFEFNGFILRLYGGNMGHPDHHKPIEEYTASLTLSHMAYDYRIRESLRMDEANRLLGEALIKDYFQTSNQKELEDFIINIIEKN